MFGAIVDGLGLLKDVLVEAKKMKDSKDRQDYLVNHFGYAIILEIRTALNKVASAQRAQKNKDKITRNGLIRSIEVPLMEAMATGFFLKEIEPGVASELQKRLEAQSDENSSDETLSNSGDISPKVNDQDLVDALSLFVSRLETIKVLAGLPQEPKGIRWGVRLDRFRSDLLRLLAVYSFQSSKV